MIILRASGKNFDDFPIGEEIEVRTLKLDVRYELGADKRNTGAIIFPVANTYQRDYVRLMEKFTDTGKRFNLEVEIYSKQDYLFLIGCHQVEIQDEDNFSWVTIVFNEFNKEKL